MELCTDGPIVGEAAVRKVVRERSGGICEIARLGICLGRATNVSHRKSVGQGGRWSTANCMDSCGSGTTGCHGWVEHHPVAARRLGLRLTRDEHPPDVPVLMRTAEWPFGLYRLDDYGTITFVAAGSTSGD
jgi:hypothetical protein